MEIKTKHDVGDKVFVIDKKECKIKQFEIGRVSVFVSQVFNNGQQVNYSAIDNYDSYPEEDCFESKEELVDFLTRE